MKSNISILVENTILHNIDLLIFVLHNPNSTNLLQLAKQWIRRDNEGETKKRTSLPRREAGTGGLLGFSGRWGSRKRARRLPLRDLMGRERTGNKPRRFPQRPKCMTPWHHQIVQIYWCDSDHPCFKSRKNLINRSF